MSKQATLPIQIKVQDLMTHRATMARVILTTINPTHQEDKPTMMTGTLPTQERQTWTTLTVATLTITTLVMMLKGTGYVMICRDNEYTD